MPPPGDERANGGSAGRPRVRLQDIAEATGFSVATVSYAAEAGLPVILLAQVESVALDVVAVGDRPARGGRSAT